MLQYLTLVCCSPLSNCFLNIIFCTVFPMQTKSHAITPLLSHNHTHMHSQMRHQKPSNDILFTPSELTQRMFSQPSCNPRFKTKRLSSQKLFKEAHENHGQTFLDSHISASSRRVISCDKRTADSQDYVKTNRKLNFKKLQIKKEVEICIGREELDLSKIIHQFQGNYDKDNTLEEPFLDKIKEISKENLQVDSRKNSTQTSLLSLIEPLSH